MNTFDFSLLSEKIYSNYGKETGLTFFYIFRGCIIQESNLIGFCEAFKLSFSILTSK
jgi:hypothetical protein